MNHRARSLHLSLLFAAPALFLMACASDPATVTTVVLGGSPALREAAMQSVWRGRPYSSLLETYGKPILSMQIPGRSAHRTFAAVYGVQDKGSNCIDAFTIIVPRNAVEPIVVDYFCR